jgi:hypothetical protein
MIWRMFIIACAVYIERYDTFLSREYTSESLTAVSTTFEDGMEKRNLY